jgi:two-component system phosphate regulon response regulator PhoB
MNLSAAFCPAWALQATKDHRMASEQGRILIVEDDASGVVIRFVLERAGFKAVLARDATEAWKLLRRRKFDLLIAEAQMPEMSGLRLCRRVRKAARLAELPIVLLTDGGRDEERELPPFASMEVVYRPFKPSALIDRISACLTTTLAAA